MIDLKVLNKLSKIDVLIVEDDKMTANALKQSLSLYCSQVYVANDGLDGFEIYENKKPDIVIADINLPSMNGLEMVEAMHEISPHLPVIIITSHDNTQNILKSIDEGVYSFLRKPIRIEELQIALLMATKNIYNSKVKLKNDYTYDCQTKLLFNPKGAKVSLTKNEHELLHLLISNIDKVVDYSVIESYVWQDKSMSLEALRMCIKKIRNKTYSDIIENISKSGYRINSSK